MPAFPPLSLSDSFRLETEETFFIEFLRFSPGKTPKRNACGMLCFSNFEFPNKSGGVWNLLISICPTIQEGVLKLLISPSENIYPLKYGEDKKFLKHHQARQNNMWHLREGETVPLNPPQRKEQISILRMFSFAVSSLPLFLSLLNLHLLDSAVCWSTLYSLAWLGIASIHKHIPKMLKQDLTCKALLFMNSCHSSADAWWSQKCLSILLFLTLQGLNYFVA